MTAHHLPIVRKIRSIVRKTGLLRIIKRFVATGTDGYEDAFSKAMLSEVTAGDIVWDIGANVGYYTAKFCDKVGETGQVVAFEPLPDAMDSLHKALATFPSTSYHICQVAVSDRNGNAFFAGQSNGTVTTTAHLVDANVLTNASTEGKFSVDVVTADHIHASRNLPLPVVTKIDVEGYEGEVIQGGENVFSSLESKHIFIEMHFERLDERQLSSTPNKIVKTLKGWGYQVKRIDPSHLHAFRI